MCVVKQWGRDVGLEEHSGSLQCGQGAGGSLPIGDVREASRMFGPLATCRGGSMNHNGPPFPSALSITLPAATGFLLPVPMAGTACCHLLHPRAKWLLLLLCWLAAVCPAG